MAKKKVKRRRKTSKKSAKKKKKSRKRSSRKSSKKDTEEFCGAVVHREGKKGTDFLLVKTAEGGWIFPKERHFPGETELSTASNAVFEHTDIKERIRFSKTFKKTVRYDFERGSKKLVKKIVYFLGKMEPTGEFTEKEGKSYDWFRYADAKKKLTIEDQRIILKKAYKVIHPFRVMFVKI